MCASRTATCSLQRDKPHPPDDHETLGASYMYFNAAQLCSRRLVLPPAAAGSDRQECERSCWREEARKGLQSLHEKREKKKKKGMSHIRHPTLVDCRCLTSLLPFITHSSCKSCFFCVCSISLSLLREPATSYPPAFLSRRLECLLLLMSAGELLLPTSDRRPHPLSH